MRKTFKIIILIIIICVVGSLGIYALSKFLPDISIDDDPDDKINEILGEYTDQTYKNKYFDLSLTLPPHWYFENEQNIKSESFSFFSNQTEEELKKREFKVLCRAVNDVTEDAIEISVEKLQVEHLGYGEFNFNSWYYKCGYFNNNPETLLGQGEYDTNIAGKYFDGLRWIIHDGAYNYLGRAGIYFYQKDGYLVEVNILADNYFGEDGSKDNAIGRMLDWFGTAKKPSTSFKNQDGVYYLNDIMSPSAESVMLYNYYRRNDPFTITGKRYYDAIPLDNGTGFGPGKTKDVVYYLDGKTYKEFSFSVGAMDERIHSADDPNEYVAFEILLDDKQVFEERHYNFEKIKQYKVDITGAKKMVIRVRDNWDVDSVVLADPVISCEKIEIKDEVKQVSGTYDLIDTITEFCKSPAIKVLDSSTNEMFSVNSKDYKKGIILTDSWGSSSKIFYNLKGKYEQFNFSTGVIKETTYANGGWLNIYLDGIKILDVELEYDVPVESYSLDVSGGHILTIECTSGIDYGIHQADFALFNMTLGEPVYEAPSNVDPGSYKLISEIDSMISSQAVSVYDGSTKYRGHYMGDIFYNEGISMKSIYSFIGSPIDSALPAKATFALDSNFKYLTFTLGRVDKSHVVNDAVVILGDGKELARYNVAATDFPKYYELDVEGVNVLQFQLLGAPLLNRGTYMIADIAVHTHEITDVEFMKPEQDEFPETVGLMERFKPYEYMSAEGNGLDAIRYFNGIYDGTDNKNYFKIDNEKYTRGFVLSTSVYLSLDGVAGGIGASMCGFFYLLALVASSEVSQASFACFNLQEQYKTLTFNIGVVDSKTIDGKEVVCQNNPDKRQQPYDTLYIFADEEVVGKYTLTGDMATLEITVDIKNCSRLAFWLDHNRNSYSYGIFDATVSK